MAFKDLSGLGALQDALTKTNELLADVLTELQETNGQRLEAIHTDLQDLTQKMDGLLNPEDAT